MLLSYAAYQWPGYAVARHHRLIADKLQKVESGEIKRLMIFMPPRHGKSMLASEFFPAWYLGRNPGNYVIAATYAQDLADDFGRKVRNQIKDETFAGIFPGIALREDSSAVRRFHIAQPIDALQTSQAGAYFAVGIGGPLTGRGAHLLLIDDPVKNREEAESTVVRARTQNWYTSTAYTRLMPGGAIIVIQCMTGDTPIMLPDGSDKLLRDVRRGDVVATHDNGVLKSSKVSNWRSNGLDRVYAIKTTSGIIVRANGRHPFLVYEGGERKWKRTKDLRPGHAIVRVNGENGKARRAATTAATGPSSVVATALRTTTRNVGRTESGRLLSMLRRAGRLISNIVTECLPKSMIRCLLSRAAYALCAGSLQARMFAPIGAGSCASIIATTPTASEDCCATTATLPSGMQRLLKSPWPSRNTCDFILDEIAEITDAGVEEVFDLQIDRTENFIANGLVSHNTRWHEDDLGGWLLREHKHEEWDVVDLPAINKEGVALWPEQYDVKALDAIRVAIGPRDWSALYQQKPTPETGEFFRAEWLRPYQKTPDRKTLEVYGGTDAAVTADGGDYTVHVVVGIDPEGNAWLLDVWRKQASSDEWVGAWCDLVLKWKPLGWAEETGQIKGGVGPFWDREARAKKAYCHREAFPTGRGSKPVRAQSFRGYAGTYGFYVPTDAKWWPDCRRELLTFPSGVHDDFVDACALVFQLLDRMTNGRPLPAEEPDSDLGSSYQSREDEWAGADGGFDKAI